MSSHGNRGKTAEKAVTKALNVLALRADTAFMRLPDAHSGSFKATVADYLIASLGKTTFLEVKEVEHEYRLPHKNFESDQVARLKRWQLAGCDAQVAVYHSTLGQWRFLDLDFFFVREGGSWDFRAVPFIEDTERPTRIMQMLSAELLKTRRK